MLFWFYYKQWKNTFGFNPKLFFFENVNYIPDNAIF